jgi:SAM-dependent methyltransferase
MLAKPKHLEPQYASVFSDGSVVAAYKHRPTYVPEAFKILSDLITDEPRAVLDLGCGRGDLARPLVQHADRVDALDVSATMIETGKRMPGGDDPRLRWIHGGAEDAPLTPPYALVVAGDSLHWMDWYVVLPRIASVLTPHAFLALASVGSEPVPWKYGPVCNKYSLNRHYQPYNLLDELTTRGLFEPVGKQQAQPVPFTQSVDEYVESFHARNGLSRDRMTPKQAAAFDRDMRALVAPFATNDMITLQVINMLTWGKPRALSNEQ